ncbi:hypothetical protein GRI40_09190 [Altererythrobacter aerius]|uniref:Uncharacterized protein n=1 Tax=Tsuneonella aeria TaxID=1837929 RepID=A0A6I4TFJ8_9SPHN|nr:hypothetical protein [Tsuneonella aeria]MXO75386.1 hypothetical protein [Tsuneonella aeria]
MMEPEIAFLPSRTLSGIFVGVLIRSFVKGPRWWLAGYVLLLLSPFVYTDIERDPVAFLGVASVPGVLLGYLLTKLPFARRFIRSIARGAVAND